MATWSGWIGQFLNAAGVLNTPPNQRFMSNWASHASAPSCKNNPVDVSEKMSGSGNCVKPAGNFPWIQHYTSHASAAQAFSRQLHTSFASVIREALDSGNPFQFNDWQDVAGQLRQWGSGRFADWYIAQMQGTSTGGGTVATTGIHKGWHDLRTTVNHRMPAHVASSHTMTQAALRKLGKARRVRIK